MGAPLFLWLYSMLNHGLNSECLDVYHESWRKLPGLKRVWIQQVEDFIWRMDVNFRVWNASEFNKSKILFQECSRCSLLHIQKICVKDIWNVCTFHLNQLFCLDVRSGFEKVKIKKFKKCCEGVTILQYITRFSTGTSKWKYWCYLFYLWTE